MVSADGGRENVWASSYYTGVLKKTTQMAGGCWGESKKCAMFKIQAAEAAKFRIFIGMVKGEAELKIFHSMLKYNNVFVAQNLSGDVIDFMGDRPLQGKPWIFKIPRDKPWVWFEVEFLSNPIEMQTYFIQEENRHAM